MNKSEAGKLGAEKSKIFSSKLKEKNIIKYLTDPKFCKNCKSQLSYENRFKTFCNSSCSASFNNTIRIKKERKLCLCCGIRIGLGGKFCSLKCQQTYLYKNRVNEWLLNNKKPGYGVIKRYLKETFGYECKECGINSYNNKPITLELEHKDGNSENYSLDNLCLLCPNCHSQTPTYKSKNKGNGRHLRRMRYKEGKSF